MYKFVSHVRMESAISIHEINVNVYESDLTIEAFFNREESSLFKQFLREGTLSQS